MGSWNSPSLLLLCGRKCTQNFLFFFLESISWRTQSCRLMRMSLFFPSSECSVRTFFVNLFFSISVTHSSRGRCKEFGILIMHSVCKGLRSRVKDQLNCGVMLMSIYKKTRRSVCEKAECNNCFTWLSLMFSWPTLTISLWLCHSATDFLLCLHQIASKGIWPALERDKACANYT